MLAWHWRGSHLERVVKVASATRTKTEGKDNHRYYKKTIRGNTAQPSAFKAWRVEYVRDSSYRNTSGVLYTCYVQQHMYHSPDLLLGWWRNDTFGGTDPHWPDQNVVTDLLVKGPHCCHSPWGFAPNSNSMCLVESVAAHSGISNLEKICFWSQIFPSQNSTDSETSNMVQEDPPLARLYWAFPLLSSLWSLLSHLGRKSWDDLLKAPQRWMGVGSKWHHHLPFY